MAPAMKQMARLALHTPVADWMYRRVIQMIEPIVAPIVDRSLARLLQDVEARPARHPISTVMLVIPTLGPGGAERQLTTLANSLAEFGSDPNRTRMRIIVACFSCGHAPDNFYASRLDPRIELIDLSTPEFTAQTGLAQGWTPRRLPLWMRPSRRRLHAIDIAISRYCPDVVHAWLDRPNILAGVCAITNRVPRIVLSARSGRPTQFLAHRPYFRAAYRRLLKSPRVVMLSNSHAGARDYESWLDLSEGTIGTIANGFDFSKLQVSMEASTGSESDGSLIVGSVFRLEPEKDPDLWIRTAALIHNDVPTTRFVLVGEGSLLQHVVDLAEHMGLAEAISIYGPTPMVNDITSTFDVFLLTSTVEGMPNVLIEAQALGIPVVTTDAGGCRETLLDGLTGYVAPDRSPETVAALVMRLLSNKELRASFSHQAKEHVRSQFSLRTMTEKYLDIYSPKD